MDTLVENTNNRTLFALNIIKSQGRKIFDSNRAMSLLARSESFFKELLNTFNGLFYLDISPQKFYEIVMRSSLPSSDLKRLEPAAELYRVYVEIMQKNGFKIPFYVSDSYSERKSQNPDIQARLDFLRCYFEEKKTKKTDFLQSKSIEYLEFSDVQQEAVYISQKIDELVTNGYASFSQIAVFADKTETRDKIVDILKTHNIPVVSSIYNEDYENLKHKISVYQKISDVCLSLKMNGFSYDDFKNAAPESKAQSEICKEELDNLVKDLLEEVLTDTFAVERILNAKANAKTPKSLLDSVHTSWHILKEEDSKLLGAEFGAIKNFYEYYKEKNYAKAIDTVMKRFFAKFENTSVKDVAAGKIKSLNELQNLFDNVLKCEPDFESYKEIMRWLPKDTAKDKNAVFLSSVSTNLKPEQTFKYVFAAGLTENNFPGNNPSYPFVTEQTNDVLNRELKKLNPDFNCFLKTDEVYFNARFKSLCDVISRAENKIIFAYHAYEAKKLAQPSVFFKLMKDNDPLNFRKIEPEKSETKLSGISTFNNEQSKSADKIVAQTDILKLNPSAISAFQSCPRKYYYKHLLNLKEPYTFAASYGSLVHAVFEVLNTRFLNSYNKETAIELAKVLLKAGTNPDDALKAGFKETDIELVKAGDELSLKEMQDNFFDAVEDFDMSGGFDNAPSCAVCEKSFTFKLEELPNVVFDGRIDAILTESGERVKVVDYKTGRDKTNTLEYAVSEYGVNFILSSGKNPSNIETLQNAYDYQIPLYFLACQNSPDLTEYKDKITEIGYVYIRPKSKNNGCDEDFVSTEKIAFYKDKIIQNLKETVIDKIVNETEFKPNKTFACSNCSYNFLCDGGEDDE